jgi:hypothetical protein
MMTAKMAVILIAHSGIAFGKAAEFVAWYITRQRYSLGEGSSLQ